MSYALPWYGNEQMAKCYLYYQPQPIHQLQRNPQEHQSTLPDLIQCPQTYDEGHRSLQMCDVLPQTTHPLESYLVQLSSNTQPPPATSQHQLTSFSTPMFWHHDTNGSHLQQTLQHSYSDPSKRYSHHQPPYTQRSPSVVTPTLNKLAPSTCTRTPLSPIVAHSRSPCHGKTATGAISANLPLIVRHDKNGVKWIAFEYSRESVKMEFTVRCDVDMVNMEELTHEFKTANCVYPGACCEKDQYKSNRYQYEGECNTVGWGLAQLNPCIRGKRDLIQRAVDSWRNSSNITRLQSRRIRRIGKARNRYEITTGVLGQLRDLNIPARGTPQ
jgi:hypothetical protein